MTRAMLAASAGWLTHPMIVWSISLRVDRDRGEQLADGDAPELGRVEAGEVGAHLGERRADAVDDGEPAVDASV